MPPLDNFIKEIKSLPPGPRILSKLLVLLSEADGHASQIVELIEYDPALTAKVLQHCNNAAFGMARSIGNLDEAVAQTGFNAIYRMVAMVIGEDLLSAAQGGYGMCVGQLWEHSVTTAIAARVIAQKLGSEENLAFTAALLHDIGKLVLNSFLQDRQPSLHSHLGPSRLSFLEVEEKLLGVHHAEIGGLILEEWHFPEDLVSAVRHHHNPVKARPHARLAAQVHLGDIIAHFLGQGQGFDSFAVRTCSDALEILGPKEIDNLVLETDDAVKGCAHLGHATS
jgi:putative nucleotidyltransferase with HDIG domain